MLNNKQIEKAARWFSKHKEHVLEISAYTAMAYSPTGEDAGSPNLWKPAHWNWFIENYKKTFP